MPLALAFAEIPNRTADRLRLPTLDAEIKQLENALNALYSERKLIQDRLDSYIYPVMTLPTEIVSEIFIQYLPPYPACPPLLGEGSPTKLAQICRRWRTIAHSTPELWRAIELFAIQDSFAQSRLQITLAQARDWLRRSHSLPLSLLLNEAVQQQDGLSLLLEHRARWEHVLLEFDSQEQATDASPAPTPLLRELSIHHDSSDLAPFTGPLEAPRLRAVFLDLPVASYELLLPSLPWGQLTRLFLEEISLAMAARILQETRSLVDLRLEIGSTYQAVNAPVLYLSKLETLIIDTYSISEVIGDFLHLLRLPALRRLHMDLLRFSSMDRLKAVIASFTCKLQRLQIVQRSNDPEQYRAAFPAIQHLEIITRESRAGHLNPLLPPEVWGHWSLSESYGSH
ncbi:hypothetical protein C8F01DRAFT_1360737 [Mycena amicta]|nr:hypothetical protein C8F01DRAFT_1360737 [Mycena amicta]